MVFDAVSPGRAGPGRFPIFYAHSIYSTLRVQLVMVTEFTQEPKRAFGRSQGRLTGARILASKIPKKGVSQEPKRAFDRSQGRLTGAIDFRL